jgi:hypothetical protein
MRAPLVVCLTWSLLTVLGPSLAAGQSPLSGDSIRISRASGPITIDGDLSDAGWRGATVVEKWYEVNPGDNLEAKVRNVGHLAFDDEFFYAGFEFDDSNPASIRAPFADRDNTPGWTDYGGVILDTRNSGHTAQLLVVNPHNIQYDSISDDASGEDSSPDFFWESATKITARGWTLEMKIPFSSLFFREAAARRQLFHLPREHAGRPRASAGGRSSGGRALREREPGGAAVWRRAGRAARQR